MKKQITRITVLVFVVISMIVSCKKDDDSSSNSSAVLNSIVQQGSWKITLFNEDGNDETHHFTGYSFQFNSNGAVAATSSSGTANGTWSTGSNDSQQKFNLNFGTTAPLNELNDDWHVLQQNASIIKLEDVSGGNGGTDLLTFEKI